MVERLVHGVGAALVICSECDSPRTMYVIKLGKWRCWTHLPPHYEEKAVDNLDRKMLPLVEEAKTWQKK